jgi:hypothetical protein
VIYIDLIEGKPGIDWERFDRDRARNYHTSESYRFTHQAIASLDGSPDEKLQQLEQVILRGAGLYRKEPFLYGFAVKDDKYCCRVTWQDRKGYGLAENETEAKTLAQIDLLSILSQHPYDRISESKRGETWREYDSWDY